MEVQFLLGILALDRLQLNFINPIHKYFWLNLLDIFNILSKSFVTSNKWLLIFYITYTMKNLFIDILAFGALLSSVLVITSKNPVIAVIFLISVFVNAAGYLILLGVGFIGISYIIVYVGAIAVLFLFVIMLLNIRLSDILEAGSQYTKNIPLALAIGILFIYEIFTIIPTNDVSLISSLLSLITNFNGLFLNSDISTTVVYNTINPILADTTFTGFLQVQAIGQSLYTFGAYWLIITSVILLLAMVAPIFLTKKSNPLPIHNINTVRTINYNVIYILLLIIGYFISDKYFFNP